MLNALINKEKNIYLSYEYVKGLNLKFNITYLQNFLEINRIDYDFDKLLRNMSYLFLGDKNNNELSALYNLKSINYSYQLLFMVNNNDKKFNNIVLYQNDKIYKINGYIKYKEEELDNFNDKNIHTQLSFGKINYFEEEIKKLNLIKDKLNNNEYQLRFNGNFLNNENKNIEIIFDKLYIENELNTILSLIQKLVNENKKFNKNDYNSVKKEDLMKNIKQKSLTTGFQAYYLYDNSQQGWINIGKKLKNQNNFKIYIEKNIQNATIFNKPLGRVLEELKYRSDNISIIYVKVEPIDYDISNSKQNNNELNEIISTIDKKNIEKQLNLSFNENKNIKNIEDLDISKSSKINKI